MVILNVVKNLYVTQSLNEILHCVQDDGSEHSR